MILPDVHHPRNPQFFWAWCLREVGFGFFCGCKFSEHDTFKVSIISNPAGLFAWLSEGNHLLFRESRHDIWPNERPAPSSEMFREGGGGRLER